MKYDAQLGEFKNKLSEAKRVLIALPSSVNNDKMAGALALYLSLKQSGKDVAVVTEAEIRVSQSVLFGIGDVKTDLPEVSSGNFILGLDGVVVDGKVPALVDLNWYPEGTTLNLVFNVVPGEKFEPINITHHYDSANFDLIIIIGAQSLAGLGNVYNNNLEKFTDTPKVDIDNSNNNNLFGAVNIIDPGAPVSEMVMHILQGMSMPQDPDIATNIITGVYDSTRGLTSNVTADTFLTIGEAMQMGGKIVRATGNQSQSQPAQSTPQGLDIRQQSGQRDQRKSENQNITQGSQGKSENRRNQGNQPFDQAAQGSKETFSSSQQGRQNRQGQSQNNPQKQTDPVKQSPPVDEEKPVGEILQPFKEDLEPAVSPRETVPSNEDTGVRAQGPEEGTKEHEQQMSAAVHGSQQDDTAIQDDTVATDTTTPAQPQAEQAPSQFEAPTGEQVSSSSPESGTPPPDWLTPKLFSGKGLG